MSKEGMNNYSAEPNKSLHLTAIPLGSIAAGELSIYSIYLLVFIVTWYAEPVGKLVKLR